MLGRFERGPIADSLGALLGKGALVEVVTQGELKPRTSDTLLARATLKLELHGLLHHNAFCNANDYN